MFTFCLLEFLDCLRTSKTCLVYAIPIKETSKGLNFYNCNVQHMYFISMDYTLVKSLSSKIYSLAFRRKNCEIENTKIKFFSQTKQYQLQKTTRKNQLNNMKNKNKNSVRCNLSMSCYISKWFIDSLNLKFYECKECAETQKLENHSSMLDT